MRKAPSQGTLAEGGLANRAKCSARGASGGPYPRSRRSPSPIPYITKKAAESKTPKKDVKKQDAGNENVKKKDTGEDFQKKDTGDQSKKKDAGKIYRK